MDHSPLSHLPFNRAVVLKNVNCPFCGLDISHSWTKEHIIGRNFVPKGSLNKQWNLILRACHECNNRKSDLEDDLSAISMLPDLSGEYAQKDESLKSSSQRKLKSKSRKTGKPVSQSHERIKFKNEHISGLTIKGDFTAPPQAEPQRIFELCRLQLAGFFFFQTYTKSTRKGGFWLEGFHPISSVKRADWGNETHISFMEAIKDWDTRFHLATADGFYRVITRLDPSGSCWAWAVEWNCNFRTIGFFGNREIAQSIFDSFSHPSQIEIGRTQDGPITMRKEKAIDDDADILFTH